jgi:tetratricopeptide (TPR) repeat protein
MTLRPFSQINDLANAGGLAPAEEEARRWLALRGTEGAVLENVGGTFIDIGNYTGNLALVQEGIELTRQAIRIAPSWRLTYNLANGLSRLLPETPEDFVTVAFDPTLVEVISLYYDAIDAPEATEPEPSFNFASTLLRAGRAIEGLDLVRDTLSRHPEHGRGWSTLGDMLWGVWTFYGSYPDLLEDAIAAYRQALRYEISDMPFRNRIEQSIARAGKLLDELPIRPHRGLADGARTPESRLVERDPWDEDLPTFAWKTGLALNLCSGCRIESPAAYDRYPLDGSLGAPASTAAAEHTAAEVNVLLQGFIGARSLFWLSRAQVAAGVKIVSWPVEDLHFSRRSAFLAAAFRESYGVLDRIADVWNNRLGINTGTVSFDKLFFEKKNKQLLFRAQVAWPESVGLRALMYLSASFEWDNGRFRHLRKSRNDFQHSLVLHGGLRSAQGWPWSAINDDDLERQTLQMLRLTRAAVIYCCEGLRVVEYERVKRVIAEGGLVVKRKETRIERS